jgi:hypothetical protein
MLSAFVLELRLSFSDIPKLSSRLPALVHCTGRHFLGYDLLVYVWSPFVSYPGINRKAPHAQTSVQGVIARAETRQLFYFGLVLWTWTDKSYHYRANIQ